MRTPAVLALALSLLALTVGAGPAAAAEPTPLPTPLPDPLGAGATGVAGVVVAAGLAKHSTGGCTTDGAFVVVIDLSSRTGAIAGASSCVFQPDFWAPPQSVDTPAGRYSAGLGECTGSSAGRVVCKYASDGFVARLTLEGGGALDLTYTLDGRVTETVRGQLQRA